MKREERTALVRTEFPRCYSSKETLAALNVIGNLIAQKKIPVMIAVFINPGSPGTPTLQFREGLFRQMASHAKRFNA